MSGIRKHLKAAIQPPYRATRNLVKWPMVVQDTERGDFICMMSGALPKNKATLTAKYIVEACNSVPTLLAAYEELERENAWLREFIEQEARNIKTVGWRWEEYQEAGAASSEATEEGEG